MVKKCAHCGKPIPNRWGIFCSGKCSDKSNISAIQKRKKDSEEMIKNMLEKYKVVSKSDFSRRDLKTTQHKRIFCYAVTKILDNSSVLVGRALGLDHTTVLHHISKITEDEIGKAKSFIEYGDLDTEVKDEEEDEITEFEKNIIRLGFSYKTGINHALVSSPA